MSSLPVPVHRDMMVSGQRLRERLNDYPIILRNEADALAFGAREVFATLLGAQDAYLAAANLTRTARSIVDRSA